MSDQKTATSLNSLDTIKLMGDPQKRAILQHLMAAPATLSQLSKTLGGYPAKIRHHLKLLEEAELVSLVATREVRGFVEKYYQASANAYLINYALLPDLPSDSLIIMGSSDPALEHLANASPKTPKTEIFTLPVGSLDGLIALRQGICHLAGCHLLDTASGDYNIPYIRHLFPGAKMTITTLAYRLQGLIVPPGNPQNIKGLQDLARDDVTFINRKPGSGTRLWLDYQLKKAGISPENINGYTQIADTHAQVAFAIQQYGPSVGLGVLAAARAYHLDFIPLFEERFDLVFHANFPTSSNLGILLDTLQNSKFRKDVHNLGGYTTINTGATTYVNA